MNSLNRITDIDIATEMLLNKNIAICEFENICRKRNILLLKKTQTEYFKNDEQPVKFSIPNI